MPPMTTRLADDEGFVTRDADRLLHGAGARRHRAHHRRDGVSRRGPAATAGASSGSTKTASCRAWRGSSPRSMRAAPGPRSNLATAAATPASTFAAKRRSRRRRSRIRSSRSPTRPSSRKEMSLDDIGFTIAAFAAAAARAEAGGLRLRRDPCRARLPDLAIHHAVREPSQRRYGGTLENRARFGLEVLARGQGRGAHPGHLPRSRSRIISRKARHSRKGGRSPSGPRKPAPTRCTSRPAIIARCRRRRA